MAVITVFRQQFLDDRTLGEMFVNGNHFGWTLEDPVRGLGIKVQYKTAIPAGVYELVVNMSARFGRKMVQIMNVPGFDGVRVHGGNGPENTSGCVLVAANKASGNKIYGTLEATFTAMVGSLADTGDRVFMAIVNDVRSVTV